jgi:hypothetical protein
MKNTIDDAGHIINLSYFIFKLQYFKYFPYSHSIVNEPFSSFNINGLLVVVGGNTMKNTMFRICSYFPLMWLQSAVALI